MINELIRLLPVSQSGQGNIQRSIEQIATPLSAIGLISLVALLWGATGMMASIRLGLETALKVDRGRPAARAKLVDFILVAAAGVLVLVIVGLSAFWAFFSKLADRFTQWAGIATPSGLYLRDGVQLLAIAVTVLLLYRFVPARKLRRRGALAGAILTAVGVWGATKVLALVFSNYSRYNVIYGSLAGRDDVPLLRVRRRVDPAPRGRVRVRVVTAARPHRAPAARSGRRDRAQPVRPPENPPPELDADEPSPSWETDFPRALLPLRIVLSTAILASRAGVPIPALPGRPTDQPGMGHGDFRADSSYWNARAIRCRAQSAADANGLSRSALRVRARRTRPR